MKMYKPTDQPILVGTYLKEKISKYAKTYVADIC
jgi:hypothetical protein